jgi:ABC-type siderophore export system fused ATPase/permease subunit
LYAGYYFVFVVFYPQSLVILLQYHISTTKHSTVPLFIRYVLLCVRCILPTITSTNVIISHINHQTFYRSRLYGMFFYVFVVFYTQSLVLMLQYHISTTKHSTVPLFIRYVLLCVRCILPTITSTNVTVSHINNQTFYRSFVYTVCSFMCLLYFTHNH